MVILILVLSSVGGSVEQPNRTGQNAAARQESRVMSFTLFRRRLVQYEAQLALLAAHSPLLSYQYRHLQQRVEDASSSHSHCLAAGFLVHRTRTVSSLDVIWVDALATDAMYVLPHTDASNAALFVSTLLLHSCPTA